MNWFVRETVELSAADGHGHAGLEKAKIGGACPA